MANVHGQEFFYVYTCAALVGVVNQECIGKASADHLAWLLEHTASLDRRFPENVIPAAKLVRQMLTIAEARGYWDRDESCRLINKDRKGGFDKSKLDALA